MQRFATAGLGWDMSAYLSIVHFISGRCGQGFQRYGATYHVSLQVIFWAMLAPLLLAQCHKGEVTLCEALYIWVVYGVYCHNGPWLCAAWHRMVLPLVLILCPLTSAQTYQSKGNGKAVRKPRGKGKHKVKGKKDKAGLQDGPMSQKAKAMGYHKKE